MEKRTKAKDVRCEKVTMFRTYKIAKKIDLMRAQRLFKANNIFCYAEGNDRYLIARGDGFTTKIFPNGTVVVATTKIKAPNLNPIFNILKKASRGGLA